MELKSCPVLSIILAATVFALPAHVVDCFDLKAAMPGSFVILDPVSILGPPSFASRLFGVGYVRILLAVMT